MISVPCSIEFELLILEFAQDLLKVVQEKELIKTTLEEDEKALKECKDF